MNIISNARYAARRADGAHDMARAYGLRQICFRKGAAAPGDQDDMDARCQHILIEDPCAGVLVGYFRALALQDGSAIAQGYSARHYDLSALAAYLAPMLEVGRFCIHPDARDPDILRVAWVALTRLVADHKAAMLFGCTSFAGTDGTCHVLAFQSLARTHLAPSRWQPRRKAAETFPLEAAPGQPASDPRAVMLAMPPLLRSYLAMGAWVSDHAVIDRDLNTLHVFTALEIAAIPANRAHLMRQAAGRPVPDHFTSD